MQPLLQMRDISKAFPGVQALHTVSLEVRPGEVVALVGENGAGKSTLLRILAGVERPDRGEIRFRGRSLADLNPRAARRLGIHCVPQELELFGQLSVCENCFGVSGLPSSRGWIRWLQARGRALDALQKPEWTYDAGANVEISDSIDLP